VVVGFVLVLLAGLNASADTAPWLIAAGMIVTGAGGGFVISPNQTLTLSEVPVTQGGVAGSMAQVGQRVGTAIGVAAIISTFYAALYAGRGTSSHVVMFREGFLNGMLVALVCVGVAVVIAAIDVIGFRRVRLLP
jgi:MFS family permease